MVESYVERAMRCLCGEQQRDPRRALAPNAPTSDPRPPSKSLSASRRHANPAPPRPVESSLQAGPPCFCQSRRQRRQKPKRFSRGSLRGVCQNSRRLWRATRFWQSQ